mgnify:CR=1 FL=1
MLIYLCVNNSNSFNHGKNFIGLKNFFCFLLIKIIFYDFLFWILFYRDLIYYKKFNNISSIQCINLERWVF